MNYSERVERVAFEAIQSELQRDVDPLYRICQIVRELDKIQRAEARFHERIFQIQNPDSTR